MRGCRFERCSFHGARLTELRTGSAASRVCFTGAQLNGSTHQRTSFANSRLVYANLFLAVLTDCQMMGVDFTDADLTGLSVEGGDWSWANLRFQNLAEQNLRGLRLPRSRPDRLRPD